MLYSYGLSPFGWDWAVAKLRFSISLHTIVCFGAQAQGWRATRGRRIVIAL